MKWHHAPTEDAASLLTDRSYSGAATFPNGLSLSGTAASLVELRAGLVAFREAHPVGIYSTKRMIDPLLDLWAMAAVVDRTAAHLIEMELVSLVEREVVTSRELRDCTLLVEAALAPLTRLVTGGGADVA